MTATRCRVCGEPATNEYLRACAREECLREAARREDYYRERFRHELESGEWDEAPQERNNA